MKIGTIGSGIIVSAFLDAVNAVENVSCVAIYSRNRESEKTQALAAKAKVSSDKIYDKMEDLLNDEEVEFIYIASPNSLHYEQAVKALKANKNVIVEKPFSSTEAEAEELVRLAKEKNLFLFEAMSVLHMPILANILEDIEKIGNKRIVQLNCSSYSSRYTDLKNGEMPNIFNPDFSGGALMDLNIYNIHFCLSVFGNPTEVFYYPNKYENGIDTSGILIMQYPDFVAECTAAKDSSGMNFALIQGEKGYINIINGVNGMTSYDIVLGKEKEHVEIPECVNRLFPEVEAFSRIYREKDYELTYKLLEQSKESVSVMQTARKRAGIIFDAD